MLKQLTPFFRFSLIAFLLILTSCEKEKDFEELAPYKSYTALLNQKNDEAPVATVLENSMNQTITWTRIEKGKYIGTLSLPVNVDKSAILVSTPTTHTNFKAQLNSATEISLEAEWGINSWNDNFTNVSLDFKEYK